MLFTGSLWDWRGAIQSGLAHSLDDIAKCSSQLMEQFDLDGCAFMWAGLGRVKNANGNYTVQN